MLVSVRHLDGFTVASSDGALGSVREVYFDDHLWVIRHLAVDTDGILFSKRVLISPHAITGADFGLRRLDAALTLEQVRNAPGLDTGQPLSREREDALHAHYGYPHWRAGAALWGTVELPFGGRAPDVDETPAEQDRQRAAANLRSSADVLGYHVEACDGRIGHIEDFLFDARSWAIRLTVVNTRDWLPGRHVLVAPQWIESIRWDERRARLKVTRQQVESSPPFDPSRHVVPDEEALRLHSHYGEGRAG